MKPVLGVAIPFFHAFPPDENVNLAKEIEERGYDTAWVGEAGGNPIFDNGIPALAMKVGYEPNCRSDHFFVPIGKSSRLPHSSHAP